jgi:calcineurin-like phosphoesterase family protein
MYKQGGDYMRYYISDLHFFHASMNEHMDNRGFGSVEEMNDYMIKQWNSRVRHGDDVIVLGDFSVSNKAAEVNDILKQLKGRKYLIVGNHDRFLKDKDFNAELFKWIEPYKEVSDNKRKVILSHYPVMCYNGQYRVDEQGNPKTYMLYGHVHNTFDEYLINEFQDRTRQFVRLSEGDDKMRAIPCNMINCFCMFSDYVPLTLDEWIELDKKRRAEIKFSDYKSGTKIL